MRTIFHPLSLMIVLFTISCSKSNNSGNGGSGSGGTGITKANYVFANSEYGGISTQVSEFYQKPLAIHFNADSTVSAFSCFGWSLNGALILHDSIHGKITTVGTDGSGGTTISVTFDSTGDQQVMTISADKSSLTGGSIAGSPAPGAVRFQFVGLEIFPTEPVSIAGSWSTTSVNVGGGYVENYYPDVATFVFSSDSTTSYDRAGLPYPNGPGTTPVKVKYWQYGSKVYFYGLNENSDHLIPYFGVLSADGKTMYVDTQDFSSARLPVPFQSNDAYGPADVTPNIIRQNVH